MGSTAGERRRTFGVVLNPVQERIPRLRTRCLFATGVPNQGRVGLLERNPAAPPHATKDSRSDESAAEYQGTYSDARDYTWVNPLRATCHRCRLCRLGSNCGKRGGGGSGGREHGRIRQIIGCHVFSESDVEPIRAHNIEECPRWDGSPRWDLRRPSSCRRISALLKESRNTRDRTHLPTIGVVQFVFHVDHGVEASKLSSFWHAMHAASVEKYTVLHVHGVSSFFHGDQ